MQAQALINNGYSIVPINAGTKGPRVKEWQIKEFQAEDIKAGVGVKTGIGQFPICAIDIDVLNPDFARDFALYCQDNFGMTVERIGQAPKTMLIYRAAGEGWSKATSAWYTDPNETRQRLEVLGKGQQFVAYHIHPDTGKPYQWVDMLGGLEATPAEDLPILTEQNVAAIVAEFDRMAPEYGLERVANTSAKTSVAKVAEKDADDFTAGAKLGLSIAEAENYIRNLDAADYDQWIRVGMALHHEFDGSDEAFELFESWSSTASNYSSAEDVAKRWASFEDGNGGVTARSIVKLGNEANAKAKHEAKHETLAGFLSAIDDSKDVFDLTDIVLPGIGGHVTPDDVVINKAVTDAAIKKSKEFGHALTKREIGHKLGVSAPEPKVRAEDDIEDRTEIGNAQRMVLDNKDRLMFEVKTETWYLFDGTVWQAVTATDIEAIAKTTVKNLAEDFRDFGMMEAKEHFAFVQKSYTARNIIAMVRLVRSEDDVRVNIEDLDEDKSLFTVANGMVDLKTGALLPADPRKRMTIASDVQFDATAECPVFEQTIREIFSGDESMVEFMARWFGYQMLGDPKEDKIGIPFGSGANGKSTLFNIIRDVFGDHAKTADASTFLGNGTSSGGGPREDILRLQGARMVNVTEPGENSVLKESLIKAMTGGESMPARGAYGKHTVEVVPTWVTNMPTNHKPIVRGDDHGIWRRLMLIPFDRNFDKDKTVTKDINRSDKLQAEKAGILNWLIRGCLQYQKMGGLFPPKAVQEATASYKSDMDLLSEFLDTECVQGKDEACSTTEIWAAWKRYAEERGELGFIPSARSLGRRLSGHGFMSIQHSHGVRGRGYLGVSVRSMFDGDSDE